MNSKEKILIVKNDFKFANELQKCLINGGYEVLPIMNNVDDAIASLAKHQPAGVVLDIQLKGKLGFDFLNHLRPHSHQNLTYNPELIVVSSFITQRMLTVLSSKKCLYFEKDVDYTHELVLNYFDNMLMKVDHEQSTSSKLIQKSNSEKAVLTDEQIKAWIHQKLTKMGFDSRVTAYHYLKDAIHYMLDPKQPKTSSLTTVFTETAKYTQYASVFRCVTRLIANTYQKDPELFNHVSASAPEKSIPTVKTFIYYIIDEFKTENLS